MLEHPELNSAHQVILREQLADSTGLHLVPEKDTYARPPRAQRGTGSPAWGPGGRLLSPHSLLQGSSSIRLTCALNVTKSPLGMWGGGCLSAEPPERCSVQTEVAGHLGAGALTALPRGAQSRQACGVSQAPFPCARRSPRRRWPMPPATCVWPRTPQAPQRSSSPSGYKVSWAEQRPLGVPS